MRFKKVSTSLEVRIRKVSLWTSYVTSSLSLSMERSSTESSPLSKPQVSHLLLDLVIQCATYPAISHYSSQEAEMTNWVRKTRLHSSTIWRCSYLTRKYGSALSTQWLVREWIILAITVSVLSVMVKHMRKSSSSEESRMKLVMTSLKSNHI